MRVHNKKKKNLGRLVLATLWVSYLTLYLNRRNVSVILPSLREWGLSYSEAGLLVSAFFAAYAAMQVPAGWLADVKGGRLAVLCGNTVAMLASIASGLSPSYAVLLASRFLCGAGQGLVWPASSKLVAGWFPKNARGAAMGLLTSSVAIGSFLALVLAGVVLERMGWQMTFIVPAVILAGATLLILLNVRDPQEDGGSGKVRRRGFRSQLIAVLGSKAVKYTAVGYFLWKFSFEGMSYWLPSYFMETYSVPPGLTGFLSGVILLTGVFTMPLGGWLSDRLGNRALVIMASLAVSGVLLSMAPYVHGWLEALVLLAAAALVLQLSEGVYFVIPMDDLSEAAGTSVGVINLGGQLGTMLAPWIAGMLLDVWQNYTPVLTMFAAAALLGMIPLIPVLHTVNVRRRQANP